ncbi:MAG: tyrosine-type recombinase/integrase [Arcobacteraceae bacterium]|nr:tyrosine-type recombinase/integrase [Arcobacteraceae bacterium]
MVKSKKYNGIYLHKLVSGDITFYIQYIDEDKKNCKIKVGRKSEGIDENYCHHKRNEIITQIRLGENPKLIQKNSLSFDEVAQKYIINRSLEGRKEESTKRTVLFYNKHIQPVMKGKSIHSISVEFLNKYKMDKVKVLSQTSVNNLLELISAIINFGTNHLDLKIDNHLVNKKVKRFKIDNKREKFLNKENVQLLLKKTAKYKKLDLAVRLALSTGARLYTVLTIQKKNIDIKNRTILLTDHKNDSTYTSYLPECYFENFDFLKALKPNDYIVSDDGNIITKGAIQKMFKKVVDPLFNIGLAVDDRKNRTVFHTLRHTYCSLLAINNVPIFTIQKLVNHKSIASTIRYAKLDQTTMFQSVNESFAS